MGEKDYRTLCYKCVSEYREAGYKVYRDEKIINKEPCDKCNRQGWTYIIEPKTDK